jgi:hypothetical protein
MVLLFRKKTYTNKTIHDNIIINKYFAVKEKTVSSGLHRVLVQVFWVVVFCGWVIPNRRFDETPSKLREVITQQNGAKIQNTCFLSKKTGLGIIKSITLLSNWYCGKLPA